MSESEEDSALAALKENYARLVDYVNQSGNKELDVDSLVLLLDESLLGIEISNTVSGLSERIREISANTRLREIKDSHAEKSEGLAGELYNKMLMQKKKLQQR